MLLTVVVPRDFEFWLPVTIATRIQYHAFKSELTAFFIFSFSVFIHFSFLLSFIQVFIAISFPLSSIIFAIVPLCHLPPSHSQHSHGLAYTNRDLDRDGGKAGEKQGETGESL